MEIRTPGTITPPRYDRSRATTHKRRGGPEVHHDDVLIWVQVHRSDRIRDPICPDFARVAVTDLEPGAGPGLEHERLLSKVLETAVAQRVQRVWNHRADRHCTDRAAVEPVGAEPPHPGTHPSRRRMPAPVSSCGTASAGYRPQIPRRASTCCRRQGRESSRRLHGRLAERHVVDQAHSVQVHCREPAAVLVDHVVDEKARRFELPNHVRRW